jgi:hypothetical protein
MYRDPKPEELDDPMFNAIWKEIKAWDINVPAEYDGYCGATGNHVCAIMDAIRSLPSGNADERRRDMEAQFQKWLDGFSFIAEEEIALARSAFYAGMGVSQAAAWIQAQKQMRVKCCAYYCALCAENVPHEGEQHHKGGGCCYSWRLRALPLDPLPAGDAGEGQEAPHVNRLR